MFDPINSFMTNNVHAIIFILFLIVTYWLRSEIGKLVDEFLTMKNLKATLFIGLVMMVFLISNIFYNFIQIDVSLVAPYMIAMSALLASLVAMINMRKSYIERVLDKSNEISSLTHNAIIKIDILLEKYDEYVHMLRGSKPLNKYFIMSYGILFENISSIIVEPKISTYVTDKNTDIFYNLHNNLFFILTDYKELIERIEKNPEINKTKQKIVTDTQLELYNITHQNLNDLRKAIERIKNDNGNEHKKLYKEEN